MKKLISIFITLVIIFSMLTTITYASDLSLANKKYISLKDAKLLAINQISSRAKNDKDCIWKNGVKISDIVTMYDLDDNPNAYAFNLTQNANSAGYILVQANSNAPEVVEFSYEGKFYSEKMLAENFSSDSNLNNINTKLYYLSPYNLLVKDTKSGDDVFYDVESKKQIVENKDSIKLQYDNLHNKTNQNAKTLLNNLQTKNKANNFSSNDISYSINSISDSAQIVYEDNEVPYFDSATFYATSDFNSSNVGFTPTNHCSATAGTTMIEYWAHQRNISGLADDGVYAVFFDLYYDMNTNKSGSGASPDDFYNGILYYAEYQARCPATGSNYSIGSDVSYSRIKANIKSTVPVKIGLINYPENEENHSVVVFGTQDCNDGQWMRIANGFDHSHCNWLKYSEVTVSNILYARWN